MKRFLIIPIAVSLLLVAVYSAVQTVLLPSTVAAEGDAALAEQYWRTGFTLKPLPLFANISGQAASVTADVQSAQDTQVYFAFSPLASRRAIHHASFYILNRTGDYTGNITMTLEIYNYAGNLRHVVSRTSVNLKTAAAQVWTDLPLSKNAADRLIDPGEFLAVHFVVSAAPGGNLDVRPVFEVAWGPIQVFLPLIRH